MANRASPEARRLAAAASTARLAASNAWLRLAPLAAGALMLAAVLAAGLYEHARATPPSSGTIVYGSVHSAALRGDDHYAVYLPSGYAGSTRRYR